MRCALIHRGTLIPIAATTTKTNSRYQCVDIYFSFLMFLLLIKDFIWVMAILFN